MRNLSAWAAIGLAVVAGCGSATDSSGSATPARAASGSPLPAIEVDDVTNDRRVALDSFVPADRPTLIWFWAPH
jgi:hypothetical protein